MSEGPATAGGGGAEPGAGVAARRRALHEPLRPRVSRVIGRVVAIGVVLVLLGVAVAVPGEGEQGFRLLDRLGIVAVGLLVAAGLWRLTAVEAIPDETGLLVRNLVVRRRLAWAEIVTVRFGGGAPWAVLDLSDGDTLPVMAVQRSDGEHAEALARRLATLVALHSRTERDD